MISAVNLVKKLCESTSYFIGAPIPLSKFRKLTLKKDGVKLVRTEDRRDYGLTDGVNVLWLDVEPNGRVTGGTRYGLSDVSGLIKFLGDDVFDEDEADRRAMEDDENEAENRRADMKEFTKEADAIVPPRKKPRRRP